MMKLEKKHTRSYAVFAALVIILSMSVPALSVDDGPRAYWKGRDGTQAVSFQYLRLDSDSLDTQQFAPDQHIYPNSDVEAGITITTFSRHLTLFDRPSSLSVNLVGGSVDVSMNVNDAPPEFLPPGVDAGSSLRQSSSGFADPSMQFVINLFGTPKLKGTADLLNYEPTFTLDVATMLAFPIGEYDSDKVVNMGFNRWYGRVALPMKYHLGVFSQGYMTSLELTPSVWLFDENDDFLGSTLENDPLWQLEGHLTRDFTRTFFGSLDLLYRSGFESEINGNKAGDELDIGSVGFTFNYQITDTTAIRTSYSSNVFGDDNLDTSLIRIQFVYAWHRLTENSKKLRGGH